MGFTIEADLNTEHSRKAWLEWKRRIDPRHYLDPEDRAERRHRSVAADDRGGLIDPEHFYGTINCNGINAEGEICGVTTTSGLAFKIPGRVGDSPILGAGLYVDGEVGAAGSTGRGEANLYNLCSYLIVEELRRGTHPKDAGHGGAEAHQRQHGREAAAARQNGDPNFNINFYILNAKGEHAGVAMYAEDNDEKGWAGQTSGRNPRYAFCNEHGAQTIPCEGLIQGALQDSD